MELITKKSQTELDRSLRDGKREPEQAQARIRKLDEIIREFVEKIYVHQSERIDGQKVKRIRIVWKLHRRVHTANYYRQ